tara:strand:+ start:2947 stop:3114 length:168 start_codon:yes stop_codon:yes gene_type:complete
METKKILSKEEVYEISHLKKIQPITKTMNRENYDIVLEEVDWDNYFVGKFVSKYV